MNKIFWSFVTWRTALFLAAFLAILIIPASHPLFPYKNTVLEPTQLPPWIWSFANFDGVHYLRIALMGYSESQYSQAFFPLYPALIRVFSSYNNILLVGLFLSNFSFLAGLFVFYRLLLLDFPKKVAFLSVLFLLLFPSAFYFGSLYTESLLFLFAVLVFFCLRKKMFIMAGVFIAFASITRLVGFFLLLPFLYEGMKALKERKHELTVKIAIGFLLGCTGIVSYMVYLYVNFHNPLLFLTSPFSFNTGRNGWFVLLPQVLFRYLKIFLTVPVFSLGFFNAALEFLSTLFVLLLLVFSFKKVNWGYWFFVFFSTLLPTLTGTLTSMPRYILTSFILFPYLVKISGRYVYAVIFIMGTIEMALTALFIRGYWIA